MSQKDFGDTDCLPQGPNAVSTSFLLPLHCLTVFCIAVFFAHLLNLTWALGGPNSVLNTEERTKHFYIGLLMQSSMVNKDFKKRKPLLVAFLECENNFIIYFSIFQMMFLLSDWGMMGVEWWRKGQRLSF